MPKKKPSDKVIPSYSTRTLKTNDRKRVAKGEDLYGYGEKKEKCNLSLTVTAKNLMAELAKEVNLSRSEAIEQLFRNHYKALVSLFLDTKD